MNQASKPATAILHPTDFSSESEDAFVHALAIALHNKASLTILHVIKDREDVVPWHDYPSVRGTLERWGHLDSSAARTDVGKKLGISVRKEVYADKNIAHAISEYTKLNECDLIVMATDASRHLPGWIKPSVAETASQATKLPTLFVPNGAKPIVSSDSGSVNLQKTLIPVDNKSNTQQAINRVDYALKKVCPNHAAVTLLHVGDENNKPDIQIPDASPAKWEQVNQDGDFTQQVIARALEDDSDLVVMVTDGQESLWDRVRGTTAHTVLKNVPCPLLMLHSDDSQ